MRLPRPFSVRQYIWCRPEYLKKQKQKQNYLLNNIGNSHQGNFQLTHGICAASCEGR